MAQRKTKKQREILPEGVCSICWVYGTLVYDTVSAFNGGRRAALYRCEQCGRECLWWTPQPAVEKGYVSYVPDNANQDEYKYGVKRG